MAKECRRKRGCSEWMEIEWLQIATVFSLYLWWNARPSVTVR